MLPPILSRSLAIPLLAAAVATAYSGRWTSWSNLNPVQSMLEHQGRLYVGTSGGVRSLDLAGGAEIDYDNLAGLSDIRVVGLAEAADGKLWAASRSGMLFRLDGRTWTGFGRSYATAGWTVSPRAFLSAGGYLVFGSEKGLTFFDRARGISVANLNKFGSAGLQPVTGLFRRGDSLYIATGKDVLRAAVDWQNILSSRHGTIFDPQIWMPVTGLPTPDSLPKLADPPPEVDSTGALVGSPSAAHSPVHLALLDGELAYHDLGTCLTGAFRVRAIPGRDLMINGVAYARNPFIVPDTAFEVALEARGRLYLGGRKGLFRFEGGRFQALPSPVAFPGDAEDPASSIAAHRGKTVVQTARRVWMREGTGWLPIHDLGFPSDELLRNEIRNLHIDGDMNVFAGFWGGGVLRTGGPDRQRGWSTATDPECLKSSTGENYTVVLATDLRGDDMWIATMSELTGSPLTHFYVSHLDRKSGLVTCPEFTGIGYRALAIRQLSDTLLGIAGETGIHLYNWGKRDGKVSGSMLGELKTYFGKAMGRDVTVDSRGRLWALYSEHLGYVDSMPERLISRKFEVKFPANVKVKFCRDMEADARGELWLGCDNGLFHVRPGADPEDPWVEQFTSENGLLSSRVLDVALDQASGDVWVVSEGGINRLEAASPPVAGGVSGIRAYPNPFLAKHSRIAIDGVPPDGKCDILTQSGSVVRHFGRGELKGNQFQWDGANAAGKRVKPGVYFYSVNAGGKTTRGKIIVAR